MNRITALAAALALALSLLTGCAQIDEAEERRRAETERLRLSEKQAHRDYVLSQLAFARAVNNLRVKQHNAMRMNHIQ